MNKIIKDKTMIIRFPRELWKFLKISSAYEEKSINDIVNELVISYKQKKEKKLTNSDRMIS